MTLSRGTNAVLRATVCLFHSVVLVQHLGVVPMATTEFANVPGLKRRYWFKCEKSQYSIFISKASRFWFLDTPLGHHFGWMEESGHYATIVSHIMFLYNTILKVYFVTQHRRC